MPGALLTWVHTSYSSTHRCSFFGTSVVTWPVLEFLELRDESQQQPLGNFEKARFITHMYTLGDRVVSWMKERERVRFSSVHSVKSESLWPRRQHTRLPGPSPTPRAHSNSCPSSWWCHPTISSSVIPFSYHLQLFLASGSFPKSQFFASGGQSIGVLALASVLPMNI